MLVNFTTQLAFLKNGTLQLEAVECSAVDSSDAQLHKLMYQINCALHCLKEQLEQLTINWLLQFPRVRTNYLKQTSTGPA